MDYVIFNSNGSVNKKHIYGYIQQSDDGVDQIFITYPGVLDSDTAQAVFTLPNQEQNTLAGIWHANYTYDPDEEPADGFLFTLTENQTRYFGTLIVAIRLIRSNTILVNFPFALIINETGVLPDTPTGVTLEQLDSYLLELQKYALKSEVIKLYKHSVYVRDANETSRHTCIFISPSNAAASLGAYGGGFGLNFEGAIIETPETGPYTKVTLKGGPSGIRIYTLYEVSEVNSELHFTKLTLSYNYLITDTISEI